MDRGDTKVNLTDLVKTIVAEMKPRAEAKHLHFRYRMERISVPLLETDGEALHRILTELLKNAVAYTGEGGDVILCVTELMRNDAVSTLEFYVQDDGIGMSAEEQARIFGGKSAEAEHGLAIVRREARKLGGNISYESGRDMGTVVRVIVNVPAESEGQPALTPDVRGDIYSFDGTRVLLVEDHPLNLEIAQSMLTRVGIQVEAAVNGEEAVRMFEENGNGYDLILMDIRMPVMDGLEATKRIRGSGSEKASSIPIIALTASAYEGDTGRSRAAGMNESILKPIDPQKLYGVMRKYLYA